MDYAKKGKGVMGAVKHCRPIEPRFTRAIGTGGGACIEEMQANGVARIKDVGPAERNTVKRGPGSK
jgi:hypothetical protein